MKIFTKIIKKIWNWIWNLRTHPSIYVFILSCAAFNFIYMICIYCEYILHQYGTGIIMVLPFIGCVLGFILFIIGYIIEIIFKRLRLSDNKIIKYVYGFGLLQSIFPAILILFFVFGCIFGII